ncbi:hypothetical protein DO021_16100 [Desulfobacter hydrogenophilus]|uniref:Uncharacterized protein n=1 Tax=Desulfobacter hydrogenophilus TaxID=2291 RepID=A0A328F8N4_9BACT|nr:hypothetical protein DO021_16100 [Desulfobacter hydrogenophilus]
MDADLVTVVVYDRQVDYMQVQFNIFEIGVFPVKNPDFIDYLKGIWPVVFPERLLQVPVYGKAFMAFVNPISFFFRLPLLTGVVNILFFL